MYEEILDNLIKDIENGKIKTYDKGFFAHDTALRETPEITIGDNIFIVNIIEYSPCRTCAGEDIEAMNHGYIEYELLQYNFEEDNFYTVASKRVEF